MKLSSKPNILDKLQAWTPDKVSNLAIKNRNPQK